MDKDKSIQEFSHEQAVNAYICGYPAVETFRAMSETALRRDNASCHQLNKFIHSRSFATSESTWLRTPNCDTLYSIAWLDLTDGPLIVHAPDMGSRYYVMHVLDFFNNTIGYIGTRTAGNGPGMFAVTPKWTSDKALGEIERFESNTNYAWIFGRIHADNNADLHAVHELQDCIHIKRRSGRDAAKQFGSNWPPFQTSHSLDFYTNLDTVLRNLGHSYDGDVITTMEQIGLPGEVPFSHSRLNRNDWLKLNSALKEGQRRIQKRASQFETFDGQWIWEGELSEYSERTPLDRAASAYAGLGALCSTEAIYPFCYVDDQNQQLNGNSTYYVKIGPQHKPEASYFWSLTVYELPEYRLVKNKHNIHKYSSFDSPPTHSDGSEETIYLSSKDLEAGGYWIPTPADKNFVVVCRIFGPSARTLSAKSQLPNIIRI